MARHREQGLMPFSCPALCKRPLRFLRLFLLCSGCGGRCSARCPQAEPVLVTHPLHQAGKQAADTALQNRRVDRGGHGDGPYLPRDLRQRAPARGCTFLLIRRCLGACGRPTRQVHTVPPHPDKIRGSRGRCPESSPCPWGSAPAPLLPPGASPIHHSHRGHAVPLAFPHRLRPKEGSLWGPEPSPTQPPLLPVLTLSLRPCPGSSSHPPV